ncbi:calcium-binding protein [Sphingomonas radiodurans]|uniref:calcium-binding protein n=1 Tax=Sphingomonas radiodurans TaxID=2890321 RepID=UPI001E644030|nr:calcium-binding protein [Sphingomonas radiodurans]WBH16713.1 calcium-binding protein [Sphingomonas radiodurans]
MALLTGTLGNDEIDGTNNADQVLALLGDDVVYGLGGADIIEGSVGNDILYAATAGLWRDGDLDTVLGGAGDDTIYGSFGDILDGGTGFDRLYLDLANATEGLDLDFRPTTIGIDLGLGGRTRIDLSLGKGRLANIEVVDRLIGTDFSDVLRLANANKIGSQVNAGGGDDVVRSITGDNRLFGESGDDTLTAGKGADRLEGGEGDDRLTGGRGQDTLVGGAGRDIFVFNEGDSHAARIKADVITDFSHADRDRIDLSRIDAIAGTVDVDDEFTFIGDSKFTGVAGELRFAHVGGQTFVAGDVDGDMLADFQISLNGTIDLVAGDLKL